MILLGSLANEGDPANNKNTSVTFAAPNRIVDMNRKFTLLVFSVLLLCASHARATTVTGKVLDSSGHPIAYASIYVQGTSHGTTSNFDGAYSLDLQPGEYALVFRSMGYRTMTHPITVANSRIVLNITMSDATLQLKEVTIKAGEDPAYNMIRKAIKKRKFYRDQVKAYSCDVYIKAIQRLTDKPKKLLGHDITNDDVDLIDTTHKIVYLSESVSKYNFRQPEDIKEEMISSKVSGDSKGFSYNSASDLLFNFYDNVMTVENLSERGFISPIAADAMTYYKYRLDGTYQENGVTVDKIEVIPRRKHDPVFRGYIYLEESGWRIYSTDVYLSKDAQIDFVDTLVVNQTCIPVENDVWMPFNNKFSFHISALGFKFNGLYIGVNTNYKLNPEFPKHFFKGETMSIDSTANKKDTMYWHDTRPVPLTVEEIDDYTKRDSIMKIRNSKKYLDSVDQKQNKLKVFDLLVSGYNYRNRYKKTDYGISPLISNIQYNTVQGLKLGLSGFFSKELERHRFYTIEPDISYGLSNNKLNGGLAFRYYYKREKFSYLTVEGGQQAVQFTSHPYSVIFNEFYTLLDKSNFLKLYQSDFVTVRHSMEIVNGIQFTASLKYEQRSPLANTDLFTVSKSNKEFTSNDPTQFGSEGVPAFTTNNALLFDAQFNFSIKQRYYTRPYEKIVQESKYPKIMVYYKKGISNVLGSNVDFDYVQAAVSGKFNLKMLGNSEWSVTGGKFLNNRAMSFMDYYHFNGNQTIFTNASGFELLPYYTYSTNDQFVWAHFEHHFGGLIVNKFPLIRKLKLGEVAGINYLTSNTLHQYAEVYVGVEKLKTFQFIFVTGFAEGQKTFATFRFGISAKGLLRIGI